MGKNTKRIVIIGGGAAGFFGAITHKELHPSHEVIILEKTDKLLSKVKISGGGRCNVTHHCFDIAELVKNYPRGNKELLSCFHQFNVNDTIQWFERRGVKLKTEQDGRMFPITDSSQTIIDCLVQEANKLGISIKYGQHVKSICYTIDNKWLLKMGDSTELYANALLIAMGSTTTGLTMLRELEIPLVEPVPSLFTFNIKDDRIIELAGISHPLVAITIPAFKLASNGPLLITHWGLSGPAILKLSAWGARLLHSANYKFNLSINFAPDKTFAEVIEMLNHSKNNNPKKMVSNTTHFNIPIRLWKNLCRAASIPEDRWWTSIGKTQLNELANQIANMNLIVDGKSTFKEEFVTAGGVDLASINMKTMQSKNYTNLFFAGEVIDVDGITGGFNFQAAWTTGYIAGKNLIL